MVGSGYCLPQPILQVRYWDSEKGVAEVIVSAEHKRWDLNPGSCSFSPLPASPPPFTILLLSTQLLTVLFESLSGPDSDTWLMSPDPLLWAMSYAKHFRYRSLLTLPASLPLSPQQAELGPLIRGSGSSHLASPDAGMGPVPTEWPQMRSGCLSSPLGGGPLDVSTT